VNIIGKTYLGSDIKSIEITKSIIPNSKSILITGMHHAREPMSFSMNLFIILKLLREYSMSNENALKLLRTRNLYFIPIINVDGYKANNLCYEKEKVLEKCQIRKNRNNNFNNNCY